MSGYLLCTSPRSGSTLLCDMLIRSGVAGRPESLFRPESIVGFSGRWGLPPATVDTWGQDYLDTALDHGRAGSAGFAARIMGSDMAPFLARLAELHPGRNRDRERLREQLGVTYFVHLSRADKVAQAVSLVLAYQTGRWHLNADGSAREQLGARREPTYDQDHIASELATLEYEEGWWNEWFDVQGISPIRVTYQQLAAQPVETLAQILAAIDRPIDKPLPEPGTARVATEVNEQWCARFRAAD